MENIIGGKIIFNIVVKVWMIKGDFRRGCYGEKWRSSNIWEEKLVRRSRWGKGGERRRRIRRGIGFSIR